MQDNQDKETRKGQVWIKYREQENTKKILIDCLRFFIDLIFPAAV